MLECPAINRIGDPHQVLFEDAAGAERQVSNLGIAELSIRQPDGSTGSLQGGVRIGREIMIQVGGTRQRPGVMGTARIQAEAIENRQQDRCRSQIGSRAGAQRQSWC